MVKNINKHYKWVITLSLLAILTITGVYAAAQFMLTKPASITVTVNGFSFSLYDAKQAPNQKITSIDFPSVIVGSLTGSDSQTPEYWAYCVGLVNKEMSVSFNIIRDGLPAEVEIVGYLNGLEWQEGTWLNEDFPYNNLSGELTMSWMMDTAGLNVGSYNFEIAIITGDIV